VVVSIIHERFSPRRQHNIWYRRGHCAVWSGDFPSIPEPPRRASSLTSHSRRPAQAGDCVRRPGLVSTHRLVCRMGGRNVGSRSRKRDPFVPVAEEKTLASRRSSNDRSETRWTELLCTTLHYTTLRCMTPILMFASVGVEGEGPRKPGAEQQSAPGLARATKPPVGRPLYPLGPVLFASPPARSVINCPAIAR
jgi:hypothetical protein